MNCKAIPDFSTDTPKTSKPSLNIMGQIETQIHSHPFYVEKMDYTFHITSKRGYKDALEQLSRVLKAEAKAIEDHLKEIDIV